MRILTRSMLVLSLGLALGACGLFHRGDEASAGLEPKTTAIGVNGYLWQATLDTLSFMPFDRVEPAGGIIVTDWYSTPDAPEERVKVTVRFLSQELRSDGIKVDVVREKQDQGNWVTAPVQAATELKLEEAILTQARRLRVQARH
ncbi:DUF3576 domain-containing protein [Kordiimonas marina]|uniref:DUF3576 domain-containing protein n=1 Tax=Kordiimonas marina TaxID=2872312 RepID=UPI001FF26E20|nr:DUF3576 domain-containing protein [Kordiimonas marina]MCJ9429830.1 DUF3576 domain-containing protein [Kordiimonas marina]